MFSYSVIPKWKDFFKIFFFISEKKFDEKIRKINNNNKYRFVSSSSWSILYICILRMKILGKNEINLLVPEYFCFNALRLLKYKKINLFYYKIDELNNLKTDEYKKIALIKKNTKPDIIILVNYFGSKNDFSKFTNINNDNYTWIIEDCTHCIELNKKLGNTGDFILMSFYKNLPLPNGALLSFNKKSKITNKEYLEEYFLDREKWKEISAEYSLYNNFKSILFDIKWVIKKIIQKIFFNTKKIKYESFFKNEFIEYGFDNPLISYLSKKILFYKLDNINSIKIKKIIINNILKNVTEIILQGKKNELNFNFKKIDFKIDTPYNFRYKTEDNNLTNMNFNKLKLNNFPVYLWPDLPPIIELKKDNNTFNKFSNIIHIANHQSINLNKFFKFFNFKYEISSNELEIINLDYDKRSNFFEYSEAIPTVQSINYGDAINEFSKNKWKISRVLFKYRNKKYAYCQILSRKIFFFEILRINKGPVFLNNCSDEIKNIIMQKIFQFGNIKKFKILFFQANIPYNSENLLLFKKKSFFFRSLPKQSTIIINLYKELHEIKSNFKYFWKYSLNRSIKNKISIKIIIDKAEFSEFCLRYEKYSELKNFKKINSKILKHISKRNNDDEKILLFQAIKNNIIYGEVCIFISFNTGTYLAGVFSSKGDKLNVNNLLLWETIVYLKKNKFHFFDLGGLNILKEDGINFFKRGMGGEEKIFLPESVIM